MRVSDEPYRVLVDDPGPFDPSPAELAAAVEAIRAEWTPGRRLGRVAYQPMTVRRFRISEIPKEAIELMAERSSFFDPDGPP